MARVNNKWEDEQSWKFHIDYKKIMRGIIESDDDADLLKLEQIEFSDDLLSPSNPGEGDPPNMAFMRRMWAESFAYAQQIGIPILLRPVFERGGKWVLALYRQDSAYCERIGGIIQYVNYNEKAWKKCKNKKQRVAFLKDVRDWWNENDTRDRTRGWIMKMFNKLIKWYEKDEFWERLINFIINWCVAHQNEFEPHQMYDPKMWFPRGRGGINVMIHGGVA